MKQCKWAWEGKSNEKATVYISLGCAWTIWLCTQTNLEITTLFFILISTKSTITTTTTTKSSTSKTTTTVTTTSIHQHETTVPTTSSARQNAMTTTTTAWDGEQWTGGLKTPRWVFFHYYYYFLLTNYLHLGYIMMLLPPFHHPPLTTQATTSTNESLWLVGAIFCFYLDHTGHNQHQWVLMTCWCYFSLFQLPCRPPHPHFDLMWHHHLSTPNDNDNKSSVFFLISILFYFISLL